MYSREYFKGAKLEVVEHGIKYRFLLPGRVWVQTARPLGDPRKHFDEQGLSFQSWDTDLGTHSFP